MHRIATALAGALLGCSSAPMETPGDDAGYDAGFASDGAACAPQSPDGALWLHGVPTLTVASAIYTNAEAHYAEACPSVPDGTVDPSCLAFWSQAQTAALGCTEPASGSCCTTADVMALQASVCRGVYSTTISGVVAMPGGICYPPMPSRDD